jgi:hypothetical protein
MTQKQKEEERGGGSNPAKLPCKWTNIKAYDTHRAITQMITIRSIYKGVFRPSPSQCRKISNVQQSSYANAKTFSIGPGSRPNKCLSNFDKVYQNNIIFSVYLAISTPGITYHVSENSVKFVQKLTSGCA